MSWCRHLLVPFLFHDLTFLPPLTVEMLGIRITSSTGSGKEIVGLKGRTMTKYSST